MDSKISEIQDQAVWALGNLAGDSVRLRDRIIQQKGYDKLLKIFSHAERASLLKQCTWAISNFCRTKPPMEYKLLKPVINFIIKAIYKLDTEMDFLVDACWILSYMSETFKKAVKKIIETKVLPKLLSFLE
jgi:importin subunit alpha-1